MLTLKTLLFRTPKSRHESQRTHPCIAKVTKTVLAMDESGVFVLCHGKAVDMKSHKEQKRPKGPYLQMCKMYPEHAGKKMVNPKCFVFCNCSDFKYRCEVALAIRGSSAIINSNGALPESTNPSSRPQVCKHLLAFLAKAVQAANTAKPGESGIPKEVKTDRELIQELNRPRNSKANIKRMFQSYFKDVGIQGTRF